jgi:hypothetical protein
LRFIADVDLDELDDARRQLVAAANLLLLLLEQLADHFDLPLRPLLEQAQIAFEPRVVALDLQAHQLLIRQLLHDVLRQTVPFFSSRSRPYSSNASARSVWLLSICITRFFTSS